ncbi:MAG TPA: N-acetyl-alpha-D-glucosaminyl L-malate synthase BshA, partial [Gemmatimonadaceae bacterium]|nr:N-acetyl-alpha-D-glucosaminyl L-malate synthase BshA [Gemmatimonadaceae bacterium]
LAVRMHEVVINEQLDLLHVHYAIPHATSAWIAKEMLRKEGRDITVITTLHGTDITIVGQDHSFHAITKFSIEQSDRVTAVSEFLKAETVSAFGCAGCEVDVIPNFIDPAVYDRSKHEQSLRRQFGAGKKILMHTSNFRPVKRVRDVVRVFAKVKEQVPSVLVMAGDGPDRGIAEEEARALGVDRDVHFLGRIDLVAPLLACADLFLLPSDRESFGLSALEALASGVPAFGYDVGGLREVVRDGVTGVLRPVGDVDGLAEHATALLRDDARWNAMSTAAAADARARFSSAEIVARYEQLYLKSQA